MPPRTRPKKLLEIPKVILEAKAFLEQKDTVNFAIMEKLTESEDAELQQALTLVHDLYQRAADEA